jgi:hypothetical protein
MGRASRIAAIAALVSAVTTLGSAGAAQVPLPVGQAGVVVTIDAADSFRPAVPYNVSGYVYAVAALPIAVEESVPLANIPVDILVDGVTRARVNTSDAGFYQTTFLLTGEGRTHTIQASVLRGTPVQVVSPQRTTTVDQVFTALNLSPTNLSLSLGASQQLTAIALDGEGREHDVTSQCTWSTNDPAVATVDGGLVQATGGGSATIMAVFGDLTTSTPVNVIDNGRP